MNWVNAKEEFINLEHVEYVDNKSEDYIWFFFSDGSDKCFLNEKATMIEAHVASYLTQDELESLKQQFKNKIGGN